ncbi:tRNA-splicing endonuclease subunit Sen54-like isoform X1 [Cucumis melo var. makuwa]|uniref:tRNA-splicing endonuclease subunit Sen54-like isoform X1 n=1 Tax=Cucumis melo var. makuwa TaxID=1194695 RepID=A0A5D3CEX0_CUCMM|nr:tRNA-splicing endonuclease subunit Sen54-like isoform X1 [Cucumis melo var. makuwa]
MEATNWKSSSGGASDTGDEDNYEQDINDEEECLSASRCLRKLQFRKHASTARWNDQMGMAEVLENKGSLWTTTGIGNIIENKKKLETFRSQGQKLAYVVRRAALRASCNYLGRLLVAEGRSGCIWEQFEVYRHLKSLGYIVGKHKVPWSLKNVRNDCDLSSPSSTEKKGVSDVKSEDEQLISGLLNAIQLDEVTPIFDVFLPHNKFRKSSPGDPNFMVCLARGYPPSKEEIEVLERTSRGIPMKYCHVEHGRVCFFSFDKVELPLLP